MDDFDVKSINLETKETILAWKWMLSKYSLSDIEKEYYLFKRRLFGSNNITPKYVENLVSSLFVNTLQEQEFRIRFNHSINVPLQENNLILAPTYLFRIRKSISNDIDEVKNELTNLCDIWEKPNHLCTQYGRLNKTSESVLYTSFEPTTAILECNVKRGDLFFLICYKRHSEITVSDCSNFVYYNNLTHEENLKRYTIFNLLRNEFTRILPDYFGEQSQYYLSYYIFQYFFKAENTCAAMYPSVKSICANNLIFFEEEADKHLDLICVKLWRAPNNILRTGNIADELSYAFWENNSFVWYDPKSEIVSSKLRNHHTFDIFSSK